MFTPLRTGHRSGPVKRLAPFVTVLGLIVGCGHVEKTVGEKFQEEPVPVSVAQITNPAARITLRGSMIEKCPVAGCWFMLRDETGTIKVDTKNSGFVVVDVPLKRTMTVSGRVVTNGSERFIDATGLRY